MTNPKRSVINGDPEVWLEKEQPSLIVHVVPWNPLDLIRPGEAKLDVSIYEDNSKKAKFYIEH